MTQNNKSLGRTQNLSMILWITSALFLFGLLVAVTMYPEHQWLTIILSVILLGNLGGLFYLNRKSLTGKTAAYGLNSAITVLLVFGIVGVINFIGYRYPQKLDLTHNKIHTLSDQTIKVVKGLKSPIKTVFYAKVQQKEQFRPLLENYKSLSPKFEVEYVDPDREPTRAKQAGIKKYGTLVMANGAHEAKVEDPTEEKLTNSLIKILKEKSPTLCSIMGHGEKAFASNDAEGYSSVKKALSDQSYEVTELNLVQEGKIPSTCDALAILGPSKSFFEAETKAIQEYLEKGGKAIIAIDINLKGSEHSPELVRILEQWYVKPQVAFVVDPISRMFGVDSSVAILASFSKDHPITRDFQPNCAFPFARPLEIMTNAPASLHIQWLGETTPKSWAITNFAQISKGEVKLDPAKDKQGPFHAAIAVEGKLKDSQATKNTRLVAFASSFFATNSFARYAGNLDFFVNSVSWVLEDESLISIRAKDSSFGRIELSQKAGTFVFLLTVVAIPLIIAVGGIVIWALRKKL